VSYQSFELAGERLLNRGDIRRFDPHSELASTNDRASELIAAGLPPDDCPCLVIAEKQTAGRGRGGNRWHSTSGSLTFSLILDVDRLALEWRPRVALVAGVAAAEAIDPHVPDLRISLKWPNDLQIGDRKLGGILVESPPSRSGHRNLVVGIGLNVNTRFQSAGDDVRNRAVSLRDLLGRDLDLDRILGDVVAGVAAGVKQLSTDWPDLRDRWKSRCALTGRRITVTSPRRQWAGQCLGIDDAGALRLDSAGEIVSVSSGVVRLQTGE
jgi:BirA family biotin operon repressor/biotin-[acetyl-CoA-carboxylase] ligase